MSLRFRRPARARLLLLALLAWPPHKAGADAYRLALPTQSPAPVRFGAAEMARSLAEAGHRPGGGHGSVVISVTTGGPGGAEAFTIQRHGTRLRVVGGDAVGAMYGLIEIGDQAAEHQGQGLLQAVRPTISRPYLPLRADSPTLWLGASDELPTLLHDLPFWKRYLAALARGRFNVLRLHGFLDAAGQPHSLLERLAPAAGVPDPEARRFLADLETLARLCRDRGIRLALTDDAAEAPAAAASAHRLLGAVPDLWALGARVTGSAGAPLAYALARAVAPRRFLAELAPAPLAATDAHAALTPSRLPSSSLAIMPFNQGSFAVPYPLLAHNLDRHRNLNRSGSDDDDELGHERGRLLWDVPAGRLAPALPWCDPDFIRRLVRSTTLFSPSPAAGGLLVEPPEAFFLPLMPHGPSPTFPPASPPPAWWWHWTWGRLMYDPTAPDSRLQAEFQRHYGREPGWHIERVLARASTIVPRLAAVAAALPAGGARVPERDPGTLEDWEAAPRLDAHAMIDVPTWTAQRLEGTRDGRLGPARMTFELAQTAMQVRNEVDTIELLRPHPLAEWHALRRQIEALCHLADFGARRLSAAAHLEMHRQTGDEMELLLASGDATLAQISWEAMQRMLGPGGEREVGQMTLPSQPPAPWGPFADDAAALSRSRSDLAQELALPRPAPRIAHVPIVRATPTRAQRIQATVMSAPSAPVVTLAYRLVDRAGLPGPERQRPMTRLFDTQAFYQAEIQGSELTEGFLEYQIRATGGFGATAVWPDPKTWRRVPVTRDETGPTLRPLRPVLSGGSALLACEAADPAGVTQVRLLLRPLSPGAPWQATEMALTGTRYSATVPLPSDGLEYSFEAADAWGNLSAAPDAATDTPYFVLLPGPPARPAARSAVAGARP